MAPRTSQRRVRVREALDAVRDGLRPPAMRARADAIQRAIGITRYGQLAVLATVVLWIVARVIAGRMLYLFAYGLLLFVLVAYAMVPRRLKLTGERVGLYPRAQEGDRLTVQLTLTAGGRVSTVVVEDRVPERLGTTVRLPITKLARGSETTHVYSLRCARRGSYTVGPLVLVANDPLGLTQRETTLAEPFELLVHPRVELVEGRPLTRSFEDPPVRPPVSRPWPSGMEFYGIREYVRGDDVRKIVWRASARTGTLMVRDAEQGVTDHVTILLNTDRGDHSRDADGISESFETAVRAAASIGVRFLRDRYHVTTDVNAGTLTGNLHGPDRQTALLDALARVEMSRTPLTELLSRTATYGRRDAHTVLVTPHLGARETAQLKLLLDSGMSVLVVALEWDLGEADLAGRAAALGCQVVGLRPGDDLGAALAREVVGAGRA